MNMARKLFSVENDRADLGTKSDVRKSQISTKGTRLR